MACHKNYAALKKNMHSKKISMQILLDLKDLKKRKIERVSIFFNVAIFPKKIFIFDPTLSPCMVAPLNLLVTSLLELKSSRMSTPTLWTWL